MFGFYDAEPLIKTTVARPCCTRRDPEVGGSAPEGAISTKLQTVMAKSS